MRPQKDREMRAQGSGSSSLLDAKLAKPATRPLAAGRCLVAEQEVKLKGSSLGS